MTYNIEMEQRLLGAMIIDPTYIPDVMATIAHNDPFTDPIHRTVFGEIRKLYQRGDKIDLYILSQQQALRSNIAQIARLTQSVDSGANSVQYARILCELYMRRKLQSFSTELASKAESSDDVGEVIQWAQHCIDQTLGVVTTSHSPRHVGDILKEAIDQIEDRARAYNSGAPTGIFTGIKALDDATGGFKGGQLIVLAGRPAMGKSAVMLHFAREAADRGTPTVIFSLEMQGRELGDRLLLGETKIDNTNYKIGDISSDDWRTIEESNSILRHLPIHIADSSNVTLQTIKAQCQQLKAKGRCGMVIIDYLQLLDTRTTNRNTNREREVSEATRQAKVMAAELDVPVILLSQLSRKVEERADKTPLLSDLRESGAIEQDADMVIFISRPAMYGIDIIDTKRHGTISTHGLGILTIAKQRNGRTGNCYFRHSPDLNGIGDYC